MKIETNTKMKKIQTGYIKTQLITVSSIWPELVVSSVQNGESTGLP